MLFANDGDLIITVENFAREPEIPWWNLSYGLNFWLKSEPIVCFMAKN